MKYLMMLLIVLGLAASDFLTGLMKAYVQGDLSSKVMRRGGINKLGELTVMLTACGLEIGIRVLGQYYHSATLAAVAGTAAAGLVFLYIVSMELVSLLENYSEINPDAVWVKKLVEKLRRFEGGDTHE
ncbi:MAG: phage holin family protein [Oscillospiraceae bacterium]|nr:phage holin family protein [Oscillospiraceae bacterium]